MRNIQVHPKNWTRLLLEDPELCSMIDKGFPRATAWAMMFRGQPWKKRKPIRESLLKAIRESEYVHLTNDEILARDKEWDERYPSLKAKPEFEHDEIEQLGKNISKEEIGTKKKEPNVINRNTKLVYPEGGDITGDIRDELRRIFGDES